MQQATHNERQAATGNRRRASSGSDKLNKARKYRKSLNEKLAKQKSSTRWKERLLSLIAVIAYFSRCCCCCGHDGHAVRTHEKLLTDWLNDWQTGQTRPGRMRWQIDQRSLVKLKLKVGLGFVLRGCSHWSIAGIVVATTATHTLVAPLSSLPTLSLSPFLSCILSSNRVC